MRGLIIRKRGKHAEETALTQKAGFALGIGLGVLGWVGILNAVGVI